MMHQWCKVIHEDNLQFHSESETKLKHVKPQQRIDVAQEPHREIA